MRIKLLTLALVALLVIPASAAVTTALNGVTTTGASTAVDTARATAVFVHIYSASTSTATVLIQQSNDNATWYTAATVTNPSSTGELWSVEPTPYTRVNVTARSAGTITATIEVQK